MNKNTVFGVLFLAAGTFVFEGISSSSKNDIILTDYQMNDHLPEGPPYHDVTRMELSVDSIAIGTTEIITMHIPPVL